MGGGSAWAINEREIIKINRDNFATSSPDPLFSPKSHLFKYCWKLELIQGQNLWRSGY